MSGTQQRRSRREAERDRALAQQRARRRRVVIACGAVVAAIAVGAAAWGISRVVRSGAVARQSEDAQRAVEADLRSEEAERAERAAAVAAAIEAGDLVPDDFGLAPGTPVDSGIVPIINADRPVACGGVEPSTAADTRPQYPGGPAQVLEEGVDHVAVITTSCGTLVVDLLEEAAPQTVNSFAFLAGEGFFDGTEIFRNFGGVNALQTGSGTNDVGWEIGYRLPDELDLAVAEGYPVGSLTTSGDGPDAAGSQFYVAFGEAFDAAYGPDPAFTRFGQVVEGLDVLAAIAAIPLGGFGETLTERVYLESVTVEAR